MREYKLDKDEKVILTVHKSKTLFLLGTIGFAFIAFFPVFLFKLLLEDATLAGDMSLIVQLLYLLWLLAVWILYFFKWTVYMLDGWIITNDRLIDINQSSLFSRDVATLPLESVQDTKVETNGVISEILGIGTVTIQSAGNAREFIMNSVPRPHDVKERILRAYEEKKNEVKRVEVVQ